MLGINILHKELLRETRLSRKYLYRMLYGGFLLAAMLGVLFGEEIGREVLASSLFESLGRVQFLMVTALGMLLGVFSLGLERVRGMLGLLCLTRMSSIHIVIGSWSSRVVSVLSIFLCGLPFFSAILLFGGVIPRDAASLAVVTTASICLAVSVGVLFSLVTSNMFMNIFLGGSFLALLFWAPPATESWNYSTFFPYRLLEKVFTRHEFSDVLYYSGVILLSSLFILVVASFLVRRAARASSGSVIVTIFDFVDRIFLKVMPFLRRLADKPVTRYADVIYWREKRRISIASTSHLAKIVVIFLVLQAVFVFAISTDVKMNRNLLIAESVGLFLAVSFLGVSMLIREKESGALHLLILTHATPKRIAWAKIRAGLRIMIYLMLIPLGHMVMLASTGGIYVVCAPAFLISVFVGMNFFFMQGIVTALSSSSSARAYAAVLVIMILEFGTFEYGFAFQYSNPYCLGRRAIIASSEDISVESQTGRYKVEHVINYSSESRIMGFALMAIIVNSILIGVMFLLIEKYLEKSLMNQMENRGTDFLSRLNRRRYR